MKSIKIDSSTLYNKYTEKKKQNFGFYAYICEILRRTNYSEAISVTSKIGE